MILDTSQVQGVHLLAGRLRAHLVAAMVVMSNVFFADVLAFLSTPRKQRCLEVIVTYDDRDDEAILRCRTGGAEGGLGFRRDSC